MKSGCCSGSKKTTTQGDKTAVCPQCQGEYKRVSIDTLLHQLSWPHNKSIEEQYFYFCSSPDCGIVYFGSAGDCYRIEQLRSPVGQKQTTVSRLICYCFDVSERAAVDDLDQNGASKIKEFVKEQTKAKRCACDIRNPSGRCCLTDFPR